MKGSTEFISVCLVFCIGSSHAVFFPRLNQDTNLQDGSFLSSYQPFMKTFTSRWEKIFGSRSPGTQTSNTLKFGAPGNSPRLGGSISFLGAARSSDGDDVTATDARRSMSPGAIPRFRFHSRIPIFKSGNRKSSQGSLAERLGVVAPTENGDVPPTFIRDDFVDNGGSRFNDPLPSAPGLIMSHSTSMASDPLEEPPSYIRDTADDLSRGGAAVDPNPDRVKDGSSSTSGGPTIIGGDLLSKILQG